MTSRRIQSLALAAAFLSAMPSVARAELVKKIEAFTLKIGPDGSERFVRAESAQPGEIVEYRMVHQNTFNHTINGVTIYGAAPEGTLFIPDSNTSSLNARFEVGGDFDPGRPGLEWTSVPAQQLRPEAIENVRWIIQGDLTAGASVRNRYRVRFAGGFSSPQTQNFSSAPVAPAAPPPVVSRVAPAPSQVAPSQTGNQPLVIQVDHMRRVQLNEAVGEVLIGNKAIADVTVRGGSTLFVSARKVGSTNIIVTRNDDSTMAEILVTVQGSGQPGAVAPGQPAAPAPPPRPAPLPVQNRPAPAAPSQPAPRQPTAATDHPRCNEWVVQINAANRALQNSGRRLQEIRARAGEMDARLIEEYNAQLSQFSREVESNQREISQYQAKCGS